MIRSSSSLLVLISPALIATLLLASCTKRLNCDSSDNEYLGTTDYSDTFKTWSIESDSDVLSFYSDNGDTLHLSAQSSITEEPRWLIESVVCEEALDVKPFKAYAYYEYEDKTQIFSTENAEVLVSIEPEIALFDDVITESIFINLSTDVATSIKGQVPVTNPQSIPQTEPSGLHFSHHELLELGAHVYDHIWILDEDQLSIYYSDKIGIAALRINEQVYYRSR